MPSSFPSKSKVCLVSLGCPKNLVDSEMMLGSYKKDGFTLTTNPQEADVIVVNTCGFIEASKKESIAKILEMARHKKEGNCRKLVAVGCLVGRHGEELARELPEVDLFVPNRQTLPDPDLPRVQSTPPHTTYVKISEGCSHICSFCTIPSIRGGLKSRPVDSVVREVREGVGRGVKEFNLIAQDLNEYGRDLKNGSNLAKLLLGLDRVDGDFWLRLLYMYPLEFTDELIGVIGESEHVVKYVDMPLQHINERILLSMKRGSPSRYVRQLLSKLKTKIPGITLRTTFIVGYPGETEEEFQELLNFVREVEFDRVGVFKFSVEEGTAAATLPDQIAEAIKEERYGQVMALQQKVSRKKNEALVGKRVRLLCERPIPGRPGFYQARLASQAPEIDGVTYVEGENLPPGEFRDARITGAMEYDLVADLTKFLVV